MKRLAVVVGNRCNISCSYCFNHTHDTVVDGSRFASPRLTEKSAINDFVLALRARCYEQVTLTGGEPLIYRHTSTWLQSLQHAGIRAIVTTNLTFFPPWIEAIAADFGDLEFHVSIGGADSEHHDRDRAGFANTLKNLERLAALRAHFALSMVLTADNFATLPDAERLANRLGCKMHISPESMNGGTSLTAIEVSAWDSVAMSIRQQGLCQELLVMKEMVLSGARPNYCNMTTLSHVLQDNGELVGCFFRGDVSFGNILTEDPGEVLDRAFLPQRASAKCFGLHCAGIHLH